MGRQQRKLLLLLACLREVERNTCRGLATLWLLRSTLLASTCRWMSILQEGRGPLSSRLPRPSRQRRTSRTKLLVLKHQRRGLPPHLTMRNGPLSDKKPEAEAVQIPIQVLDKEVAPVYPTLPAEESTTSSSTPRNTSTSANETQDQGAPAPA